ncbi:MAG: ribonuclease H-like domain-containing protein [Bacteroidia bacterium]|nr:ribonuclease H-like domain-containing protein [Bacteroidia bacterium]MDW8088787.1 ribonuclease H-like domain-containing protein [Bacteroidia bacterium]
MSSVPQEQARRGEVVQDRLHPNFILFLDIETVPIKSSYVELEDWQQKHWKDKYHRISAYLDESAIHALFGRVACIGLGRFHEENGAIEWHEYLITDLDEKNLLEKFISKWLNLDSQYNIVRSTYRPTFWICGHNLQDFDIPFLGRRMVVNGINLPSLWKELQYKPPWQSNPGILDTIRMWSFGSFDERRRVSLEVLAQALGIDFVKSLSHREIRERFYQWEAKGEERAFDKVKEYCLKDVRTVAHICLQLIGHLNKAYLTALNSPHTSYL